MSSGLECRFMEITKDNWYYILEDYNAPSQAWDWREYATAYGPFSSEEASEEHLRDNHSNPGGSSSYPLPEGQTTQLSERDTTLTRLINEAVKPTQGGRLSSFYRGY